MYKSGLMVSIGIAMTISTTYGQSLHSPRTMALGGSGAYVKDTRGFDANPAGIANLRDWEFSTMTYSGVKNAGFVFQGLTFGKRFLENEAVAISFTPGALVEFSLPAIVVTNDSGVPASIQQRVSYRENVSFAYAHRFSEVFSAGLLGRFRNVEVNDTKYELVQQGGTYVSRITPRTASASVTAFDIGVLWQASPSLTLALSGRNIIAPKQSLSSDIEKYMLNTSRAAELSGKFSVSNRFSVGLLASTRKSGSIGFEFEPTAALAVRSSLFLDKDESPAAYAFSIGAGWNVEFLTLDAAYIRFFGPGDHTGSLSVSGFDASRINNITLNPYTPDRVMISLKAVFGNVRESLARIEGVDILSGIYPSSFELFAFRPLGHVRVRNISTKPLQARASFFVERFMDAPTESPAVTLLPGETQIIPFSAVLNDEVRNVTKLTVRDAVVTIRTTDEQPDDRFPAKVLIHGRNDWDGDVHTLRHFVTPDDPAVLRYTRDVLLERKDSLAGVPRDLEQFAKAKLLFNTFAGKLVYVGDPKQSTDYVQYPSETLTLSSGDCDDMTVCFVSLLSSIGISTAFIDVVPPDKPEASHIYLMFDTGLPPSKGQLLSDNPKRYIVRPNKKGEKTLWIPVETTVITKGFETAWLTGAREYYQDAEIGLGLIKGWVRIVDVN